MTHDTDGAAFRNAAPSRHFTMIRNAALRDQRLSLRAKGLLALMLSFPSDWTYRMPHLLTQSSDGRHAHYQALRELRRAGYVQHQRARRPDGTLGESEYTVSDAIPTTCQFTTSGFTRSGFTRSGESARIQRLIDTKTEDHEDVHHTTARDAAREDDATQGGGGDETLIADTLTSDQRATYTLGEDRGSGDMAPVILSTRHRAAFAKLITFRKLTGPRTSDTQFRVWARAVLDDVRDTSEQHVVQALTVTVENFASLRTPFSFYRRVLQRITQAPTDVTSTDSASDAFADLVQQAKEGTL